MRPQLPEESDYVLGYLISTLEIGPLPLLLSLSLSQGALILKILRGKFPPVTGYSPDISDLIKRCLTQV